MRLACAWPCLILSGRIWQPHHERLAHTCIHACRWLDGSAMDWHQWRVDATGTIDTADVAPIDAAQSKCLGWQVVTGACCDVACRAVLCNAAQPTRCSQTDDCTAQRACLCVCTHAYARAPRPRAWMNCLYLGMRGAHARAPGAGARRLNMHEHSCAGKERSTASCTHACVRAVAVPVLVRAVRRDAVFRWPALRRQLALCVPPQQ